MCYRPTVLHAVGKRSRCNLDATPLAKSRKHHTPLPDPIPEKLSAINVGPMKEAKMRELRQQRLSERHFDEAKAEYPWMLGYVAPASVGLGNAQTGAVAYKEQLHILATNKLPAFTEDDLESS